MSAPDKKRHLEFKRPQCTRCGRGIASIYRYKGGYKPTLCGMCARAVE